MHGIVNDVRRAVWMGCVDACEVVRDVTIEVVVTVGVLIADGGWMNGDEVDGNGWIEVVTVVEETSESVTSMNEEMLRER